MSDYTPTTEEIRADYIALYNYEVTCCGEHAAEVYDAAHDFDRWLAEVKAQAIGDAIAYLKTTPAVTLTGKGGGYELLEAYRQDAK